MKSAKTAAEATAKPAIMSPLEVVQKFDGMVLDHRAKEAIDLLMSPDLIEHDPTVKGGSREGLYAYMLAEGWSESNPNQEQVDTVERRFASGEYVVTHHHIHRDKNDRGTVFIDIVRVVDGKIVEHWDVAQAVPEKTNDNPHTMW
jgi:predicted SnoaL-like aldol condensation-catalyzing enzyme